MQTDANSYEGVVNMYLVFFLIWIIFNGQFTLEIAAFGVVVSGLIYWFICRFLGYRPSDDIWLCKRFFLLIHYVFVLVTEILKANMAISSICAIRRTESCPPTGALISAVQSGKTYREQTSSIYTYFTRNSRT